MCQSTLIQELKKRKRKASTIDDFLLPPAKKVFSTENVKALLSQNAECEKNFSSKICDSEIVEVELQDDFQVSASYENSGNPDVTMLFDEDDETNSTSVSDNFRSNDIGSYMGKNFIDSVTKRQLLVNHWVPPNNYLFPFSSHNKRGKIERRYAKESDLQKFQWLVLSDVDKGYYCKYCALFSNALGGVNKNTPLKRLVTKPLAGFAKLVGKDGDLTKHEQHDYHLTAVQDAKIFLNSEKMPEKKINNVMKTDRIKIVQKSRNILKSIIDIVLLLGR